jgi:hypothetical protein
LAGGILLFDKWQIIKSLSLVMKRIDEIKLNGEENFKSKSLIASTNQNTG